MKNKPAIHLPLFSLINAQSMGKLRDHRCHKSKNPTKAKKNPIKIKYISSPMMVKASNADEFRAIVQELTGRNSDVGEPSNVPTTLPEEANQVHSPFHVDSPPAKVDDKSLLDTFQDDMSSLEFDEGFLWRAVPENLFGFQSPFIFV
ncbi:uncharacterized protein LOC110414990 [Herrania umbratica]|uniref:Uncharacterized protein LOC110414990 n=1 Tax=Herrania umbratica TaxID=108875 RepID=A0A6J1A533_9ROSI|nr:uncharacterized protein LOC110414990 [Herrania umbratica]